MNAADRTDVFRKLIAQTIIWLAIAAALLFVSAGTVRWPEALAYLGIWFAGAAISGSSLARENPDTLKERARVARHREEDMLEAEFPGYSPYARCVKYRMIPGIW